MIQQSETNHVFAQCRQFESRQFHPSDVALVWQQSIDTKNQWRMDLELEDNVNVYQPRVSTLSKRVSVVRSNCSILLFLHASTLVSAVHNYWMYDIKWVIFKMFWQICSTRWNMIDLTIAVQICSGITQMVGYSARCMCTQVLNGEASIQYYSFQHYCTGPKFPSPL